MIVLINIHACQCHVYHIYCVNKENKPRTKYRVCTYTNIDTEIKNEILV